MLSEHKIVVIGGTGLIGSEVVRSCYQNGASVIVAGRDSSSIGFRNLCRDAGVDFPFVQVNTSDPTSVDQLFKTVDSMVDGITSIVNCEFPHNSNYGKNFEEVAFSDFCNNVMLHIGSAFLVCQKAVEYFSTMSAGVIVNISSIYGFLAPRFQIYAGTEMTKEIEYAICKSAIIQMTRYLARYVKGRNIRINCVSPGGVLDNQPKEFLEKYNEFCLNKGMLNADDIVGTVVFLLSDNSRYMNGQNIVIDDGFSL